MRVASISWQIVQHRTKELIVQTRLLMKIAIASLNLRHRAVNRNKIHSITNVFVSVLVVTDSSKRTSLYIIHRQTWGDIACTTWCMCLCLGRRCCNFDQSRRTGEQGERAFPHVLLYYKNNCNSSPDWRHVLWNYTDVDLVSNELTMVDRQGDRTHALIACVQPQSVLVLW